MDIRKGKTSVKMKEILKLTKQIYEPLSNSHYLANSNNLQNSFAHNESFVVDEKLSEAQLLNKNLHKSIYSANAGELINEIYFEKIRKLKKQK